MTLLNNNDFVNKRLYNPYAKGFLCLKPFKYMSEAENQNDGGLKLDDNNTKKEAEIKTATKIEENKRNR